MPSGRRTVPKTLPYRNYGVFSDDGLRSRMSSSGDSDHLHPPVMMPKHIPIPEIPADSNLLFELMMFAYTTIALSLQYVNLYRTVWWLPHSHVKYAVNFYLIDVHLTTFIIVMLSRRLLWCIFKQLIDKFLMNYCRIVFLRVVRVLVGSALAIVLVWCTYHIVHNHPLMNMLYLFYPITIYCFLFGTNLSSLFELMPNIAMPNEKNKIPDSSSNLQHFCYFTADAVRDEVELLKTDFNDRIKRVLFNSLLSAYYTGFIPCCFAQSVLMYDVYWVTQHVAFTWLSCFILHLLHAYPPRYCDILHRSALHLGRWQKIESRNLHIPYLPWSDAVLWHQSALVKHSRELFRAEGVTNAAEPGNSTHLRFYAIFINPSTFMSYILFLHFVTVLLQLITLIRSAEWNHVIAIATFLFCNYHTLFKLFRDYLVLRKIYRAEQMIQEQILN